jgi:N-acetylneuraminic acid mutarotase
VLDGRLYVAGGFGQPRGSQSRAFEAFDPATDKWTTLAPLPEARDHAALTPLGGRLFLSGGNGPSLAPRAGLWIYDPAADRWSAAPPMPGRRSAHAAVAVDGRLYVLGGVIADHPQQAPTWRYDPANGTWDESLAPPPTYREHVAAVALDDGTIVLIGGRAAGDLAAVERYDPRTNAWTSMPALPTPRGGLTAAVLDGAIHVTGGEGIDPVRIVAEHDVLAPGATGWALAPPLPAGRHGLASGVIDGRWYVAAGGLHPDLAVSDVLTIFEP